MLFRSSQAPYLRKTSMAVSVEFCGRFSLPMPDTAAATLDGMDTHIPPGEERKTLEEIRELSVTIGDTVEKRRISQGMRSGIFAGKICMW